MAAFDGAILDRIHHARARNNFASRENLDLELAASGGGDALGHHIGTAEDGVKAFGEARCQAPFDGRQIGREGGGRHRTDGDTGAGLFQE